MAGRGACRRLRSVAEGAIVRSSGVISRLPGAGSSRGALPKTMACGSASQ